MLYQRLDARLCDRTRFFAAAAFVNAVLARLPWVWVVSTGRESVRFLHGAGGSLERFNLEWARSIPSMTPGRALDYASVFAEQTELQRLVECHRATVGPRRWDRIFGGLNRLLNHEHAVGPARRWPGAAPFAEILAGVRARVDGRLDFATQAHRVSIGAALIEQIRLSTMESPFPSVRESRSFENVGKRSS